MVFFNYATMQMAAKIVYYGPGLCGKTTNLHHIYTKTSPQSRGEMVSLETETDRTLFFDLLPIDVGVIGGFKTRLQLYTVPGQVFYNTTRKLVLKGVDGIVFVADSQVAMLEANVESLRNLRENLAEIGTNLDEIPIVIQLNKRDLPNISPVETMLDAMDPDRRAESVEAIAASGVGVFETLKLISKLTLRGLRRRMTGDEPVKAPPSRAAFRVQDNSRTMAGSSAAPAAAAPVFTGAAIAAEVEELDEVSTPAASSPAASATISEEPATMPAPEIARHVIADAPVEAIAPELPHTAAPLAELVPQAAAAQTPEGVAITEVPQALPVPPAEVKTVKVRSSVDVMAELESLRKRATSSSPKAPKRDIMADLAALRPRRDINRTLHLEIPAEVLPRARSVRVTLSFQDGEEGVIDTRDQQLELGDTSDVQSLSVNLKIDLA